MSFTSDKQRKAVMILLHKAVGRKRVGRMKVGAFGRATVDPGVFQEELAYAEQNYPLPRHDVYRLRKESGRAGADIYHDLIQHERNRGETGTRKLARDRLIQHVLDNPKTFTRLLYRAQRKSKK